MVCICIKIIADGGKQTKQKRNDFKQDLKYVKRKQKQPLLKFIVHFYLGK